MVVALLNCKTRRSNPEVTSGECWKSLDRKVSTLGKDMNPYRVREVVGLNCVTVLVLCLYVSTQLSKWPDHQADETPPSLQILEVISYPPWVSVMLCKSHRHSLLPARLHDTDFSPFPGANVFATWPALYWSHCRLASDDGVQVGRVTEI